MYNSNKIFELTKENIYKRVNNLELLQHYLPGKGNIYMVKCPFHKDNNPSLNINLNIGRWKCFSCNKSGDSITYIMQRYNANYNEALKIIASDFGLMSFNIDRKSSELIGITYKEKKETTIQIKHRNWENRDLEYWKQFNISLPTLKLYNIYPLSHYWINNILITVKKTDLTYGMLEEDKFQIYSPYADKKVKWFSNTTGLIYGISQLPKFGDILFINSSKKDIMTLYETCGYFSIAPTSESSKISESVLNDLKSRFNTIIILFNNDQCGLKSANSLSNETGLPFEFIPYEYDPKDLSDFIKEFGITKFKEMINNIINKYENII